MIRSLRLLHVQLLVALLATGCSALSPQRYDQSLPTTHWSRERPIAVQVDPSPFPGERAITVGLFPAELEGYAPIERFEELIETALGQTGGFEVTEQGPGEARSDATYRLEFTVAHMESEKTQLGWLMSLLGQQKPEYAVVGINYQLFNNVTDEAVGTERQIVDHFLIDYQSYRLPNMLGMRAYFDKLDKRDTSKRHMARATMRSVKRLVADIHDQITEHQASREAGNVDRG